MKIYHSFWEEGWNNFDEKVYNMHKLSALLALKNYGNITLITTNIGKELLSTIPYTNIELFDPEVDLNFKQTWSISKLFAYRQIIKKNEPFFHIDYDVFLFKKMPNWFETAKVVYQHNEDSKYLNEYYKFDMFFQNCKNTYNSNPSINYAYNLGIFGGTDIKSISFYIESAFELLYDSENKKNYWFNEEIPLYHGTKATIVEQWYLACCLNKLGVMPTPLLPDNYKLNDDAIKLGYCHVWGAKHKEEVHKKIANKIKKIESENIK